MKEKKENRVYLKRVYHHAKEFITEFKLDDFFLKILQKMDKENELEEIKSLNDYVYENYFNNEYEIFEVILNKDDIPLNKDFDEYEIEEVMISEISDFYYVLKLYTLEQNKKYYSLHNKKEKCSKCYCISNKLNDEKEIIKYIFDNSLKKDTFIGKIKDIDYIEELTEKEAFDHFGKNRVSIIL